MKKKLFFVLLLYSKILCEEILNHEKDILNAIEQEENTCTWIAEYHIITDLIKHMNLKRGCEIGVAYGLQSKYFLENASCIEVLYSIDPYKHFPKGYDDLMNLKQEKFEVLFNRVKKRLSIFKNRSKLLRKESVEAAKNFENESLEFIYIDGNHSYEAVTNDLYAWYDKIRPGGLISGDDYNVFHSVKDAVDNFVHKNRIKLNVKGNKWWFIKEHRPTNEPFISGDNFRNISDHTFDDQYPYGPKISKIIDPDKVKIGDIVFVATEPVDNLENFFINVHPKIKNQYILITHNGDCSSPGKFINYLNENKIFTWFGQNSDVKYHPKFIPIPIGLENELWNRNYKELITDFQNKVIYFKKKYLLYGNFNSRTNFSKRNPVETYFKQKSFCHFSENIPLKNYLSDLCNSYFVLSPEGNGLDCHRTWEALYLDIIPVVKSSTLDSLFEDLPVLIISDWQKATKDLLEEKISAFKKINFNKEKLYFHYWENLIKEYKNKCKSMKASII